MLSAPPSNLNLERVTSGLLAALVEAQKTVTSIKKDSKVTGGGPSYEYASHNAVLAYGREHLASHGLALISGWTVSETIAPEADIGRGTFVCGSVRIEWALVHAGDEPGVLTGWADIDAIAAKSRPPDKAVAAAVSYGLGYVMRGILLMDKTSATDDVDARDDAKWQGSGRGQRRQQKPEQQQPSKRNLAQYDLDMALAAYRETVKDPVLADATVHWRRLCSDGIQDEWPRNPSTEQFRQAAKYVRGVVDEMKSIAREDDPTSGPGGPQSEIEPPQGKASV